MKFFRSRIPLLALFLTVTLGLYSEGPSFDEQNGDAIATEQESYHLVSSFPYRLAEKLDEATIQKSTEPDPSALRTEVRWDFDATPEKPDWTPRIGLSDLAYSGGVLQTTVTDDNALLLAPLEWEMPAADIGQVSFRIRLSEPRTIGFCWGDESGLPKLKGRMRFQVPRAGEFFELKAELNSLKGWDSTVKWCGIDLDNCKGVVVELDWFAFTSPVSGDFISSSGLAHVCLGEESRNALYAFSPSTIEFNLKLAEPTILDLGLGIAPPAKMGAVFDVQAQCDSETRHLAFVTDVQTGAWRDIAAIDLSEFTGKEITLRLRTDSDAAGTVTLWSNPMLLPLNPRTDRPNVVVYLVDALRADGLGVYGNTRNTSPFIDSFAATGILFERCFTPASWTLPSVASLFTSTSPPRHGASKFNESVPDSLPTAAEALHDAGYITASFVTNPIAGRMSNLHRGFDFVTELNGSSADNWADGATLNAAVFPWLDRYSCQPIALYVHATDTHSPYTPPKIYEDLFLPATQQHIIRTTEELAKIANPTKADIENARALYDAEVRYTDDQFHLFCDKLERLGIQDRTLTVFTADHGEGFYEHKLWGHGNSLYNEITSVPLIIGGFQELPKGVKVPDLVQLLDVYPTLFTILGVPIPEQFQGSNLVPNIYLDHSTVQCRTAYFASGEGDGFWTAKIDFPWKLLQDAFTHEYKLFNLEDDSGEQADLTQQYPEQSQAMRESVEAWLAAQRAEHPAGRETPLVLDEGAMERLRALGYVK